MSRRASDVEPLERYAGGEIEVRPGRVNRWLLVVYAVLAVWGAPSGHEDDPERALRTALDVVAAVGAMKLDGSEIALAARAAVMTGEAAVAIGTGDHAIVSGDLVNAASRLQSAAPAGVVLMDTFTHRATESSIAAPP